MDQTGTYAPQLGSYLIDRGYQVTITALHPKLFTLSDRGISQEEIKKRFEEILVNTSKEQDKKVLNYFLIFLKKGGKIEVKIPEEKDIADEIKEGRPLGALLTSNFLKGNKPRFNFHFNVLIGIEDDKIIVNDPSWNECGGENTYNVRDFLYGLYASAFGDLDNACLIKIKRN
ncbi:MAG: papain-like cysteine protease family protein [Nanoarchaeota archaeon]|nr:papain-like cysteine protease family protein [Nanoarchaeota archaeon]